MLLSPLQYGLYSTPPHTHTNTKENLELAFVPPEVCCSQLNQTLHNGPSISSRDGASGSPCKRSAHTGLQLDGSGSCWAPTAHSWIALSLQSDLNPTSLTFSPSCPCAVAYFGPKHRKRRWAPGASGQVPAGGVGLVLALCRSSGPYSHPSLPCPPRRSWDSPCTR